MYELEKINLTKHRITNMTTKLSGETILITGGAGSLGSSLTKLLAKDNKVIIYSRSEERQHQMKQDFFGKEQQNNLQFVIGDLRNTDILAKHLQNSTIAIHAAAMKDLIMCEEQVRKACLDNIDGSHSFLQACKASHSLKVICGVSTDKAASPSSVYGCTKYIQEQLFREASRFLNAKICSVRFGNMIDSRGSLVPEWKKHPESIRGITHPEVSRFFFTLEDAAKTVMHALTHSQNGDLYIRKMKKAKIIDIMRVITGKTDFPVIGLFPGEKVHEDLLSITETPFCHVEGDYYVVRSEHAASTPCDVFSTESAEGFSKEELSEIISRL